MPKISKKDYSKKKGKVGRDVHREGKYYCDCLVRKFKTWLGKKKYGFTQEDISQWKKDC